jgi:hypothetical protein
LSVKGIVHRERNELHLAESCYRRSIEIAVANHGAEDILVADFCNNLASKNIFPQS